MLQVLNDDVPDDVIPCKKEISFISSVSITSDYSSIHSESFELSPFSVETLENQGSICSTGSGFNNTDTLHHSPKKSIVSVSLPFSSLIKRQVDYDPYVEKCFTNSSQSVS